MRFLISGILVILALASAGCVITVGSGGDQTPGGWQGPGMDKATFAEIDAAADLTFDNGKRKAFVNIASRPHLSGHAQVYLVKKAMGSLTFDDSKQTVLLALVKNPYFVAEGKQAVLEHLDALMFDSGKEKVLQAINRRGHIPTERELHWQLEHQIPEEPMQEEGSVQMETTGELETSHTEGL